MLRYCMCTLAVPDTKQEMQALFGCREKMVDNKRPIFTPPSPSLPLRLPLHCSSTNNQGLRRRGQWGGWAAGLRGREGGEGRSGKVWDSLWLSRLLTGLQLRHTLQETQISICF